MLQRIQSVWLLLAAACAFLTLKTPYYSGQTAEGYHQLMGTENLYFILLTTAVAVLALITIFLYKPRPLQLRLCVLGILLEAGLIFLYYKKIQTFIPLQGTYSLTALLHSLIVIFFVLAARGINKDEKIIKESNRLR